MGRPLPATRALDGEWVTFDVPIAPGAEVLSLIIHRGDEQDSRVESLDVSRGARSLWLVSGNPDVFESEPDLTTLPTGDVDLGKARAIWVSAECIAVPFAVEPDTRVELVAASRAGLYVDGGGASAGTSTATCVTFHSSWTLAGGPLRTPPALGISTRTCAPRDTP